MIEWNRDQDRSSELEKARLAEISKFNAKRREEESIEVARIRKEVAGQKEEFDYIKYIFLKSGNKIQDQEINPISSHAAEVSYYLINPKIRTIEEFINHEYEIEG